MKKFIYSATKHRVQYIRCNRTKSRQVIEEEEKLSNYIRNAHDDYNGSPIQWGHIKEQGAIQNEDGLHHKLMFWRIGTDRWEDEDTYLDYDNNKWNYNSEFGKSIKKNLIQFLEGIGLGPYVESIRMIPDGDRGRLFYSASVQFNPDVMNLYD